MFKIVKTAHPCRYCEAAMTLLADHELLFEVEVREGEVLKAQGFKTVPQIWHGETYIGGHSDLVGYLDKIAQPTH